MSAARRAGADDDAPIMGLVRFTFDGRDMTAQPGQSIAAALLASGIRSWRTTRVDGRPRGLFCGIGACQDCLVEVDGRRGVRACVAPARAGTSIVTGDGDGDGDG